MGAGARAYRLAELAEAVGGEVEGDGDVLIHGVGGLDDAEPGTIVRVEGERYLKRALESPASALLVDRTLGPLTKPAVRVDRVRLAYLSCLELFAPVEEHVPGVHPTAVVAADAEVDPTASVGPFAAVGRGAKVGPRAVIHPHAVVGDGCEVGEGSVLFPHAVLYAGTVVGARVRIHAGAVIGADGFGYEWDGQAHRKRPHLGRVRLGDDVEIGANTTIDRGTTGETVIGPGTKIDNQVQVGHNVRMGAHCIIVSQVGLAGSVTMGNGVVMGGQSGANPHAKIGDGAQIAGKTGVWSEVAPGAVLFGLAGRPYKEEMRIQAALGKLPELLKRVRDLERRLAERETDPE
jgi:UDP-3-O-[3-hydroxymyristoyl] glucosamine N-acyltransferase